MPADNSRPVLRWLHISDLHSGLQDDGFDRNHAYELFLEDVTELSNRIGSIDVVFFTGDLTQAGTEAEFEEFDRRCVEPLLQALNKPRLFAIPGNHDLAWPTSKADIALAATLQNEETQKELWQEGTGNEAELTALINDRFAGWEGWWRKRRPDCVRPGWLPGSYLADFEVSGLRIGIAGLNTAILQLGPGIEQGTLAVHKRQLTACGGGAISEWLDTQDISLLLTHHPPDWLTLHARRESLEQAMQSTRFDLHLFGHMHESQSTQVVRGGGIPERTLQAPSLFGLEYTSHESGNRVDRRMGYTVGELRSVDGQFHLSLWPRQAIRGQDRNWRFVSDRSYRLQDDYLSSDVLKLGPAPQVSDDSASATMGAPEDRVPVTASPDSESAAMGGQAWWDIIRRSPLHDEEVDRAFPPLSDLVHELERLSDSHWPRDEVWLHSDYLRRALNRLADCADRNSLSPLERGCLLAAPCLAFFVRLLGIGWLQRSRETQDALLTEVSRVYTRLIERREALADESLSKATDSWLRHRALDRWTKVWDPNWLEVEMSLNLQAVGGPLRSALFQLARALSAGPAYLFGESGIEHTYALGQEIVHLRLLGGVLAIAGVSALDVSMTDELLLDHIGPGEPLQLDVLQQRLSKAHWTQGSAQTLHLECHEPVVHFWVDSVVRSAQHLLEDVHSNLRASSDGKRSAIAVQHLSQSGVKPALNSMGEPAFSPAHVRFRLDHTRVRELLMGHRLYNDPNIALRELYQNALDACRYRRARTLYLQKTQSVSVVYKPEVIFDIGVLPDGRPFVECTDNGVGMTHFTLSKVFSVAGRRFHDQPDFAEERSRWGKAGSFNPNSQHGIGVLSYFLLADQLDVRTRPYQIDGKLGREIHVTVSSVNGLFRIAQPETETDGLRHGGTRVRLIMSRQRDVAGLFDSLRNLLQVAEVDVRFSGEGEELFHWHAGRLYPPPHRSTDKVTPAGPDVWWSDNESCALLVDGLATRDTLPFCYVNLTGERYPLMSVDRNHAIRPDLQWLPERLANNIVGLANIIGDDAQGVLIHVAACWPSIFTGARWHQLEQAIGKTLDLRAFFRLEESDDTPLNPRNSVKALEGRGMNAGEALILLACCSGPSYHTVGAYLDSDKSALNDGLDDHRDALRYGDDLLIANAPEVFLGLEELLRQDGVQSGLEQAVIDWLNASAESVEACFGIPFINGPFSIPVGGLARSMLFHSDRFRGLEKGEAFASDVIAASNHWGINLSAAAQEVERAATAVGWKVRFDIDAIPSRLPHPYEVQIRSTLEVERLTIGMLLSAAENLSVPLHEAARKVEASAADFGLTVDWPRGSLESLVDIPEIVPILKASSDLPVRDGTIDGLHVALCATKLGVSVAEIAHAIPSVASARGLSCRLGPDELQALPTLDKDAYRFGEALLGVNLGLGEVHRLGETAGCSLTEALERLDELGRRFGTGVAYTFDREECSRLTVDAVDAQVCSIVSRYLGLDGHIPGALILLVAWLTELPVACSVARIHRAMRLIGRPQGDVAAVGDEDLTPVERAFLESRATVGLQTDDRVAWERWCHIAPEEAVNLTWSVRHPLHEVTETIIGLATRFGLTCDRLLVDLAEKDFLSVEQVHILAGAARSSTSWMHSLAAQDAPFRRLGWVRTGEGIWDTLKMCLSLCERNMLEEWRPVRHLEQLTTELAEHYETQGSTKVDAGVKALRLLATCQYYLDEGKLDLERAVRCATRWTLWDLELDAQASMVANLTRRWQADQAAAPDDDEC